MFGSYPVFINLIIIAFMLILVYFKSYFRAVYLALKLPGPPALPILGNSLSIKNNRILEMCAKASEMWRPVTRFWISVFPAFVLYEPQHLQTVLGTNKFTTKNEFYSFLYNFLGTGLITSSGEKWKQHRKLIQPYFHINFLKMYFDAFYKYSTVMVRELEPETDVNIVKFAKTFVLDVLEDTVLGYPLQRDPSSPYRKGEMYMLYRLSRPWLLFEFIFKRTNISRTETEHRNTLRNYTRKIFENKKKSVGCGDMPLNSLLEILIKINKENPEFTEEDIIDETCTFMLAGQDSLGAALTFSLYFLAANQHIQNNVMDELNSIFQYSNRPVTFEDTEKMRYLEQCIKETMRLCPSVPMIARKLTEDLPLGKHVLPAGANIVIAPFVTHHLPHIFPDPFKFDPERFSPENKTKIHPYAYIPFSAGPRNCIGYKFALIELKTVISEILRTYHLSLTPGHEKLNLLYRVTLKAKNGIWLRLKKRQG